MFVIRSLFIYIFFISSIVLVSLLINILYLFASTKTLQNICKYWITLNNKALTLLCNINYEVSGYKHIPKELHALGISPCPRKAHRSYMVQVAANINFCANSALQGANLVSSSLTNPSTCLKMSFTGGSMEGLGLGMLGMGATPTSNTSPVVRPCFVGAWRRPWLY